MQIKPSLFAILLVLSLVSASKAEAQTESSEETETLTSEEILLYQTFHPAHPRVLAAEGPGEDKGAVSVGVTMFGPIPTFDLRYVRGLGSRLMIDGSVATIGVLQRLRLGARYLVLDQEEGSLAIRASLMEAHSFAEPAFVAGAGPGLLYSFGDDVRITLAIDLAWSFLESTYDNPLGGAFQIQPSLGVEIPLDDDLELFIEASALTAIDADDLYALPLFSAGLAW
jgi:hypothetical protein